MPRRFIFRCFVTKTLSEEPGIGGTIKTNPEGFVVKEITKNGVTLEPNRSYTPEELGEEKTEEGKFTTFVLQKRSWDTIAALTTIAKRMGKGKKSIGYSGTKDKMSISTQLASVFGITPEQLAAVRVKDISINGSWRSNGVEMGTNIGNAFEVEISDVDAESSGERIENTLNELNGMFPNYFDRQRFGIRMNNARIGILLMKNDFEGAVLELLTNSEGEKNEVTIEARKRLAEERDFKVALDYFPKYLRSERSVIAYLSEYDNYANAMRKISRGISIMFIHSVESLIFNVELEERIKNKDFKTASYADANFYGFPDIEKVTGSGKYPVAPLIGYQTSDEMISDYSKETMEKLAITKESFKIKSMPELSMKGAIRTILAPVKDVAHRENEKTVRTRFSIPSGSYATIFLNELMKNQELDLALLTARSA